MVTIIFQLTRCSCKLAQERFIQFCNAEPEFTGFSTENEGGRVTDRISVSG